MHTYKFCTLSVSETIFPSFQFFVTWLLGRKAGSSSQVRFSLLRIMLGLMTSPHMGSDMWRNGGPYSNVQSISEQFLDRIPPTPCLASVSRRLKCSLCRSASCLKIIDIPFHPKILKKEGETVSGTERILNFYVDMYSASYLVSAQPTQAKTAVVWCGYITFFVCGFTYWTYWTMHAQYFAFI